MHGMGNAGPIGLQVERLALEIETAVRDAIGKRHQGKGGSIVAASGLPVGKSHRPQQVDIARAKARNGAAGPRRQIDGESADLQ